MCRGNVYKGRVPLEGYGPLPGEKSAWCRKTSQEQSGLESALSFHIVPAYIVYVRRTVRHAPWPCPARISARRRRCQPSTAALWVVLVMCSHEVFAINSNNHGVIDD